MVKVDPEATKVALALRLPDEPLKLYVVALAEAAPISAVAKHIALEKAFKPRVMIVNLDGLLKFISHGSQSACHICMSSANRSCKCFIRSDFSTQLLFAKASLCGRSASELESVPTELSL